MTMPGTCKIMVVIQIPGFPRVHLTSTYSPKD
jgi:hypothetical protein